MNNMLIKNGLLKNVIRKAYCKRCLLGKETIKAYCKFGESACWIINLYYKNK